MMELKDNFGRVHNYLRLSLTDICNLNCAYCNPDKTKGMSSTSELMSVEQKLRIVELFVKYFGFKKIRLTGGEPLAGKDVVQLLEDVKAMKQQYGFELCITTNGTLLKGYLPQLNETGIEGINISLDSLNSETYSKITGHNSLIKVLKTINEAYDMGFDKIKINCVVMRGVNDDEITAFVEHFRDKYITVRFIEYMPFAQNGWNADNFINSEEMILKLSNKYNIHRIEQSAGSVSSDYRIEGINCRAGFISSISNHFCNSCNRLRVTSEGKLRLCLFGARDTELDLKNLMDNPDLTDLEIAGLIAGHMRQKAYEHLPVEQLVKMDFNYMLKAGG